MPRHVEPVTARKGIFLKSFPIRDYKGMLGYCAETENALARHSITDREIVYTRMARWGKSRAGDTWQIYLVCQK